MKHVANQAANHSVKHVDKVNTANSKPLHSPYNVGTIDRMIRYSISAALIGSVFYLNPAYAFSLGGMEIKLYKILPLIGIYPAITAWLGWDPIYHIARIKSCTKMRGDVCGSLVKQAKVLAQE